MRRKDIQSGWLVKEIAFHRKEEKREEISEARRHLGSREAGRVHDLPTSFEEMEESLLT